MHPSVRLIAIVAALATILVVPVADGLAQGSPTACPTPDSRGKKSAPNRSICVSPPPAPISTPAPRDAATPTTQPTESSAESTPSNAAPSPDASDEASMDVAPAPIDVIAPPPGEDDTQVDPSQPEPN